MSTGKIIKKIVLLIVSGIIVYGVSYAWRALPIISGYGAKDLCSCVMIGGRNPEDVIKNELGTGLLSVGTFTVNYDDSSATGTVFGLAKQKAIFRKGLGCTLVVEMKEEEFRKQKFNIAKAPALHTDTIAWPMGNKLPDTLPTGINYEKLNKTIAYAFEEPGEDKLRKTRAIVVIHDGKLISEKYADGFDEKSKQIGWSMSKSITNALVGILVKQGKLKINEIAPVSSWKNDERNKITLNDLMHMSSGLDWEENYAGPSGATNMLFKKKDMGVYAASVAAKHEAGKVFYYSSGTTNIISRIIHETIGDEKYYRFPSEELFNKLGMYSMVMEADAGGTFVGSSYSFATARDWARFGMLYVTDGVWQNERILPEGWVKYSSTPTTGAMLGEYGAQFWLNAGAPDNPEHRTYPDVPTDLLRASGYEGQNVFIIPSKKLVVVKLSLSQGDYLDDNKFLADIITSLP